MKKTEQEKQTDVLIKIACLQLIGLLQATINKMLSENKKFSEILITIENIKNECDRTIDPITSLNMNNEFYKIFKKYL